MLYSTPPLGDRERAVLDRLDELKRDLRYQLGEPRRWTGSLRRMTFARNIQGSNSIEGFVATLDDAAAVAAGDSPTDVSTQTRLALEGYRNAMTYILQLAQDPPIAVSPDLIRSLHFMMTHDDLTARPGRWRAGSVYVQREETGDIVHEGAVVEQVPGLMDELVAYMNDSPDEPLIRGAMAHLNLVMIHPFKDGNGRMARALQSLSLTTEGSLSPVFLSVEEYLGRHTEAYYEVLGITGGGHWSPDRDARPWLRFTLTAHLRQALTQRDRVKAAERIWEELLRMVSARDLPDRAVPALFDAAYGLTLRRSSYMATLADEGDAVSEQTATRDLKMLADAGLLTSHGDKRGRTYTASPTLAEIGTRVRNDQRHSPIEDPFAGVD